MPQPEIKVRVGHDDKALNKGLSRSEKRLRAFSAAAQKAARLANVAFVAASAGIVLGLRKVTIEADKIAKSAQKMGVAAEELQRLQHAAGLSGVAFESLRTGVGLANKNLALIASGQGEEARRAIEALGIDVRKADGSMKSASETINEVADKFARFKDGVNKSAIAMSIFGRSGADMVPLLNSGSAAIEEAKGELNELGAVMSGTLLSASERFNDNISRLKTASFGFFVAISESVVPALAVFTGNLVKLVKESQSMIRFGKILGQGALDFAANFARGADLIANSFEAAFEDIKFLWGNLPNVLGSVAIGTVNTFIGAINSLVSGAKAGINELVSTANAVLPKFAQINPLDVDAETVSKMTNPYAAKLEKPLVAHAERIGKIMAQRTIASLGDGVFTPPAANDSTTDAPGFKVEDKEAEALREKLSKRLEMLQESFLTEEELSAVHLAKGQELIDEALDAKLLSEASHRQLTEQLEERHQKTLADIRDAGNHAMLNGLGDVLGGVGDVLRAHGEKNLKIVKGLSIAQALIAAYTGAAEALKLPFPGNVAAFAGVLAKGLGAVASIKSISTSGGGASGGAGGGRGSGNSGAETSAATAEVAAPAQNSTVTVEGLNTSSIFDGPTVKDLISKMLDMQRDGHKVVLV